MVVRVAFVDDHPILLEGLVSLYSSKADLDVVAMGHNTIDALQILEQHRPDVIVMDLSMPGDSFAAIDLMLVTHPYTKVIVFTASSAIQPAVELIEAGISGYVLKGSSSSDLHEAILRAHDGETYITPGFATKVIVSMKTAELRRAAQPKEHLHHREEQIIGGLLKGMTNREIGTSLNLSEKTVKHYMTSLMSKLDVRNRVELVIAVKNRAAPKEAPARRISG
ncbi:response regulator [Rhizobium sp. G187]|uniref:response regulator n=1 Tax=unclassified Rhizobium TaxID=2613769 RepID=UPI0006B9A9AB|nr:response regulator transcription factor [Rhizobium sp. AAP43]KPF46060.1 response regulator receiver protein [Rhizobium sp. AAP43]